MNKYQSLLFEVQSLEVEYLHREYELRKNGIKIFYLSDPDELRRYCFPFGLDEAEKTRTLDRKSRTYIADEQILLHSIYGDEDHRHLIPVEYFDEMRGMIRYSAERAGEIPLSGNEAFEYFFRKRKDEVNQLLRAQGEEGQTVAAEFVGEHFTEALASATMLIKGAEKLSTALNKYLILEDKNADTIEEVLDALAWEGNIPELEEDVLLQLLDKVVIDKKLAGRLSKRRDVRIIRKLIMANLYCVRKNLSIRFLYFTDADSSIALLNHLFESDQPNYKPFAEFPLYRNRRQMFVRLLCESSDETHEGILANYQQMIESTRHFNELVAAGKFEDGERGFMAELEKIKDYYKQIRNKFENENIFRHYQDELADAAELARKYKDTELITGVLQKLADTKDGIIKNLAAFSERLSEMTVEHHFNNAVIAVKRKENLDFNLTTGKDGIAGKYHHLPILFYLDDEYQEYLDIITEIITADQHSPELVANFRTMVKKLTTEPAELYQVRLLKILTCLIVRPYSQHAVDDELYQLALLVLRDIKAENKPEFVPEFIYLTVWLARRATAYKAAIKYCDEIISKQKGDPMPGPGRFYHGRFLARYCIYLENPHLPGSQALLKPIIEDILFARQGYNTLPDGHVKTKLRQSLLNSLAFLYTELALTVPHGKHQKEYLEIAREHLEDLKREAGQHYQRAEYFHTESVLEYYESFYDKNPVRKLEFAEKALEKAINSLKNPSLMPRCEAHQALIDARKTSLHI